MARKLGRAPQELGRERRLSSTELGEFRLIDWNSAPEPVFVTIKTDVSHLSLESRDALLVFFDALVLESRKRDVVSVLSLAYDHISELADAWQRGCIREHDGKGGTRQNRNADLLVAIRKSLAQVGRLLGAASESGKILDGKET